MLELLRGAVVCLATGMAGGWAVHSHADRRTPSPPPAPEFAELEVAGRRLRDLETQISAAIAEISSLRAASGIARPGEDHLPPTEGSLVWRNRWLETKVRYLQGQITDLQLALEAGSDLSGHAVEAGRLSWRNSYLRGRVRYLEEEMALRRPSYPPVQGRGSPRLSGE